MTRTVLRCDEVSRSFGGVGALNRVSVSFQGPSVAAIVGPNGAGKTTLLNVVTGFVTPDSGTCYIDDQRLDGLAPDRVVKCGVSRTFQSIRLIRRLSVMDNVLLARPRQRGERLLSALTRRGVGNEEAGNMRASQELLEFVGLEAFQSQPADKLSFGQQKLLTLACCLATDARVLLLDEPIAGVHPELADRILHRLKALKEDGRLIVFVEHDLAAVRQVCDSLVVMEAGRVIANGTPADVLALPAVAEAFVG